MIEFCLQSYISSVDNPIEEILFGKDPISLRFFNGKLSNLRLCL